MGQQYGSDGSILYCTGLIPGWEGKPLIYTKEVSNLENGGEAEGYRCGKYEIKMGTSRVRWIMIGWLCVMQRFT